MTTSIHTNEEILASILVQITIVIMVARLAGVAASRLGQPRAVGEIVAGLMLGPSLFGYFFPALSAAIFPADAAQTMWMLSQIGLILLMFQIGSEFEFGHLRKGVNSRAVALVAIASLSVPFVTGFLIGRAAAPILAPNIDSLAFSLFVAVAMAITAVPILGRILAEYGLTRTPVGVIAITAAAANDVVGWIALAIIAAIVSAGFSLGAFSLQLAGLLLLMVALWLFGRPLAAWLVQRFPSSSDQISPALIAAVVALMFLTGVATQELGIFTIFGGFLVGLLFHPHVAFVDAWRRTIGQFVLVFFLPIFFTLTGLRTNMLGLDTASEWLWCAALFAASVASKIIPVYLAARFAGLPRQEAAALGVLMNTRALMELIVLNIGLSMGVIPQDVFTMLVIMAVGTTLMTGPLLNLIPSVARSRKPHVHA
ncbi:MAG: cation:proton antiporter [Hyphomonadaceae bacterium]|nr:cation:proton antiporter [Hyphomonadaceae bacterium]